MFKKQLAYCPDLTLNCFHISVLPPRPCLQADRHLVNILSLKSKDTLTVLFPPPPYPAPNKTHQKAVEYSCIWGLGVGGFWLNVALALPGWAIMGKLI